MIPLAQNPPNKFKKKFFILNYTTPLVITGFEQLSSSIFCQVMAGQSSERENYAFSEKFWIRSKLGFWPIILATDMLASQSSALQTRIVT